jgi:hypothetical protein
VAETEVQIVGPFVEPDQRNDSLVEDMPPPDNFPSIEVPPLPTPDDPDEV